MSSSSSQFFKKSMEDMALARNQADAEREAAMARNQKTVVDTHHGKLAKKAEREASTNARIAAATNAAKAKTSLPTLKASEPKTQKVEQVQTQAPAQQPQTPAPTQQAQAPTQAPKTQTFQVPKSNTVTIANAEKPRPRATRNVPRLAKTPPGKPMPDPRGKFSPVKALARSMSKAFEGRVLS